MDRGMKILKWGAVRSFYILMPLAIIMALAWSPSEAVLGDFSRIIYFHVPVAWVSVLAFLVAGLLSIAYLVDKKKRHRRFDEISYNSASIGLAFAILTVITGSLWARLTWGSFWNWDPRETSVVVILLIYVAYFSLQSVLSGNEQRGVIGSSYLILAMIMLPFFVFLAPRIYDSLHPETVINADKRIYLDGRMKMTLLVSVLAFSSLYAFILQLMNRMLAVNKATEDLHAGD
jgi:heme exporter protein C